MTPETILTLASESLTVTSLLAAPLLLTALATGVFIGVLQAATQINEMTLTFIPKLVTIAVVLMVAGGWLLKVLLTFTVRLFQDIPGLIG